MLAYLFTGFVFLFVCWVLGWLLLSPFRLLPDQAFAAAPAVGFLVFSTATALLYAQAFTGLWLILIVGLLLYARFGRHALRLQCREMLRRVPVLMVLSVLSFGLATLFAYHVESGLPFIGPNWHLDDLTYWGHLSESIKVSGKETTYYDLVFSGQVGPGAQRYHFVEIWATAGLTYFLPLNPSLVLQLIIWPSIAVMTALAFYALLFRLSGNRFLALSFAALAISGQFWSSLIFTDISEFEMLAEHSAYPLFQPIINKFTLLLGVLTWITYALVYKQIWLVSALTVIAVVCHPLMSYYLVALWLGYVAFSLLFKTGFRPQAVLLIALVVLTESALVFLYHSFGGYWRPDFLGVRQAVPDYLWAYAHYETRLEIIRTVTFMSPAFLLVGWWLLSSFHRRRLRHVQIWTVLLSLGLLFSVCISHYLRCFFIEGHQLLHVLAWLVFSLIVGVALGLSWKSHSQLGKLVSVGLLLTLAISFHWRYSYSEWQRWQQTPMPYQQEYLEHVDRVIAEIAADQLSQSHVLSAKLVTEQQYIHTPVFALGRFLQGRLAGRLVEAGPVVDLSFPFRHNCQQLTDKRIVHACERNPFVCWLKAKHPDYGDYSTPEQAEIQLAFMKAHNIQLLFLSTDDQLPRAFKPYVREQRVSRSAKEQLFMLKFTN